MENMKEINKSIIEDLENKVNQLDTENQITQIYILYNMKMHFNFKHLDHNQKEKIIDLIYYLYIKDENNLDLSNITCTIMGFYKEALNGEITKYNIYEYIEKNNNIPLF